MIFETKTVNAAIFDMDGTMFDTERLRMKMLKQASKILYGKSMEDDLLMDSLGLSAQSSEELAKKRYGDNYPYKEIRKKADELELEYVRKNGVPIKKGLIDVLERLKKNGILLAVATSSKRSITEEYLMRSYIMSYFDIIICGDEVKNGKPNPEIFLKAASELNCEPSNCLIFEDSQNGLLAASASGGISIFVKDMKEPKQEIKARAFKAYDSMVDFLNDLIKFTAKMPKPRLNEHFPRRFNHMKVGIHGFGAIGGGYLTQIFSHWDGYTRPVEIVGACRHSYLRELVNAFGKFNVHYENLAFDQTITNVRLVDIFDEVEMKKMYTESEIIGLSLPETAIKQESVTIAKGLIQRYRDNGKHITILVILNKIGGALYVKRNVENALKNFVGKEESKKIISNAFFCETVVNRMVSKINKKTILKQARMNLKTLEGNIGKKELDIGLLFEDPSKQKVITGKQEDQNSKTNNVESEEATLVKGISKKLYNVSQITQKLSRLNITLFNSEPDILLYASKGSPILERLRQIKTVDNISKMQDVKNKLSNGTHAIIAWYSSLLGYKTIGQGMGDERIILLVKTVMKKEIKPAILKHDPELEEYVDNFIANFIKRCRYSFKDPCIRVGRDPLRKLQNGERILGTIDLAQKNEVSTPMLEFGAAAGLLYAILLINPDDKECKIIKELYDKEKSIKGVLTYQGNYNGKPYQCLDEQKDADLIARIEKHFKELIQNYSKVEFVS
ncbi:bifunctional mannitol-1-phosphate dehydrogenase/phosphatase [Clostridium sp. DJ247]|uniref:bifunctional mannitol-1-phosphate dehydrogenase/phosphatase n=1 Tax=Clostridium sp. DJ247 TaxID=2726188 RepID=UPI001627C242|nr:HAD family hydrolase [Clostridium sp. DJ247]MBC2582157.1 HAD-IA family hydrolase [Clostridium sp. DJ247]